MSDPRRHPRAADLVVWTVWLVMLASMLWFWTPASSSIPMAEDWYTVPFVTGNGSHLASWLWEQNNEHRMPVARLVLLGVLVPAGGDYRAGGLLNMTLLAGGAAALILFTRHLRGGRTDMADAFFPAALLNFGHSVDVLFPFQITFVLSLAWIMLAGCPLFLPQSVTTRGAATTGGIALALLPLSGLIGMLFVPGLAAYYFWAGLSGWRGRPGWRMSRGVSVWLMTMSVLSVMLAAAYFIGYEHPTWNPPNPGLVLSAKVILKMLALGFGPAPMFWWAPGVAGALLVVAGGALASIVRVQTAGGWRDRAAGPVLFFAIALFFVAAVGWGRAGYVPEIGIPLRYVSIALPAFIAVYLLAVTSGHPVARFVPAVMAAIYLLVLPVNTRGGYEFFANWYADGMRTLEADIDRGVSLELLAARHGRFLVHWWTPEEVQRHMRMLQQGGIAPFDRVVNPE